MTRAEQAPLPLIPALPEPFRRLAQHQLRDPRTSSDHLLIMADGLIEAAETAALDGLLTTGAALRILAAELRGLAPLYGHGAPDDRSETAQPFARAAAVLP